MSNTLEGQLSEFKGHQRLRGIADLMKIFDDKHAEKLYDNLRKIVPENKMDLYISHINNASNYSDDRGILTEEELKLIQNEIFEEINGYLCRTHQVKMKSNSNQHISPEDILSVVTENVPLYTYKRINK
ncbi:MAG: hypothetical protein VX028_00455 [Nanoarchaeota archaeon]|nr:hypothetical protein [Nanoarchaeota archaeon]